VRKGLRVAAIFPTQAEAIAYGLKLAPICMPQMDSLNTLSGKT
jgi:hypothetical protein